MKYKPLAISAIACTTVLLNTKAQDKPNILWITCEDISPYLGSYGCKEALTPNLDRLASEGVRYTHAYAIAPVSAVSRSAILTGMHSTTIGTHQMRSVVQLPDIIPTYPQILRKAGYYCTNNSKEDYNSNFMNNPAVWNESSKYAHYNKRGKNQPFFAVFNALETHESRLNNDTINSFIKRGLIPSKPHNNPEDIILPPYHPDLPAIREDWVHLHELITMFDNMVGERLKELEESGQSENTIVFFYSDHGGMLARSKRYMYNVGTQVPLIVRFPKKWQHLAPTAPGKTVDELVSLMDLPKTIISLAGAPIPDLMQGRIITGPAAENPPATLHFYRDRMSERYDFSRAVTDGRYYFIRNYMPNRPNGRDITYGYDVQANWRVWRDHYEAGLCNDIQSQFFQSKPVIEFFDTQTDPWHVNNLAEKPEFQKKIRFFEKDLDKWMIKTRDIGLIPEPMFYEIIGPNKKYKTLYEYAQSPDYKIDEILKAAKISSIGNPKLIKTYLKLMVDKNPMVRYWGAYALFLVRSTDAKVQNALRQMITNDMYATNRIMAAQAIGLCGDSALAFRTIYREAENTKLSYVFLQALNAFQFAHVDDKLTLEDWKKMKSKINEKTKGIDNLGFSLSTRIIEVAISNWPKRVRVD